MPSIRHFSRRWSPAAPCSISTTEPAPDSPEAFITEHYWGYTRQRNGSTHEYRVEHPAWRVWPATVTRTPERLEPLYGTTLASAMARPASVLIADGSKVAVSRGELIRSGVE